MDARIKSGHDKRHKRAPSPNEGALFPAIAELLGFPDWQDGRESLIPLVRLPEFCHFEDE
jgi:hypothetical protein